MPSKKRAIKIKRSACLAIIASAAEVFPKECMGCVCYGSKNAIVAAFPYQVASRKDMEVCSDSSVYFDKMFKTGLFKKLGDFHSHTFQSFEKLQPLTPSPTDLNQLPIGGIEVIVQIRRTRKKSNSWRTTKGGSVSIAWDRYRFLIAAFMRIDGHDKDKVPLYKKVGLLLDGTKNERKL